MIVMADERIKLLASSTSSRDDLNYSKNILVIMMQSVGCCFSQKKKKSVGCCAESQMPRILVMG
jgi:hypothetical protein